MGHPRPLPVAFPVHSGFDMIFAHILEDVMRKVSDRKRIMISADNAFQRTGLTGLRIPGSNVPRALVSARKSRCQLFHHSPAAGRRFRERRGNQTERRKTAPLPSSATYPGSERQTGKVLFQRAVFNGMNGVEIFTKQFQIAEIVFQQLPTLANFISPCRLRRRSMGTGKHAVAVKAVIFAVEFFCVHQLRDGL